MRDMLMVISGTVAALAGIGALFFGAVASSVAHDEGYKDGFNDASKIYEAKFIALRDEAEKSRGIISEQKRLLSKANDLILELQAYMHDHDVELEPDIVLTYAKTRELTRTLLTRAA